MFKQITSESKPKKSSQIDNLPLSQLKFILSQIADPPSHIFNLSLQTGYISIQLKTAQCTGGLNFKSRLYSILLTPIDL